MNDTMPTGERAVPMPLGEPDWTRLYSCPTCHDTGRVVEGDGPDQLSYPCECEAAEQQPSGPTAERVKAIIEECGGLPF
jgi:hypothetical protein